MLLRIDSFLFENLQSRRLKHWVFLFLIWCLFPQNALQEFKVNRHRHQYRNIENVELPLYSRLHRRQVQTNKQKQPHLSKIDFCSYDGVKHHCSVLDAWLCPEPSIKTENNVWQHLAEPYNWTSSRLNGSVGWLHNYLMQTMIKFRKINWGFQGLLNSLSFLKCLHKDVNS